MIPAMDGGAAFRRHPFGNRDVKNIGDFSRSSATSRTRSRGSGSLGEVLKVPSKQTRSWATWDLAGLGADMEYGGRAPRRGLGRS